MSTNCPECGARHFPYYQSTATLFSGNLIAATCDCWTGYRIYDQTDGRLLDFDEMFLTSENSPKAFGEAGSLMSHIYALLYEKALFLAHDKAESMGEWVTIPQMHNFLCEDPRVLRSDLELIYGDGGGTEAERRARRDREKADLASWRKAFPSLLLRRSD